jgi:hypothetical protein
MWFTKITIKNNVFRELKINISPPGQGFRLPLRVRGQVAITINLIRAWRGFEMKNISPPCQGVRIPFHGPAPLLSDLRVTRCQYLV